jgi:hypothetical protein
MYATDSNLASVVDGLTHRFGEKEATLPTVKLLQKDFMTIDKDTFCIIACTCTRHDVKICANLPTATH